MGTIQRLALLALLVLAGCSGEPETLTDADPCAPPNEEAATTGHWPMPEECRSPGPIPYPYPFTTPTPPDASTPIDGDYVRAVPDAAAGPVGKCTRCPPYRLELGDTNTLRLHRGAFEVEHELAGWTNAGHYLVEGDTVTFFNDPNCTTTRGIYRWSMAEDGLTFELMEDDCAFGGLRARYLTAAPWSEA